MNPKCKKVSICMKTRSQQKGFITGMTCLILAKVHTKGTDKNTITIKPVRNWIFKYSQVFPRIIWTTRKQAENTIPVKISTGCVRWIFIIFGMLKKY
jgi:hypothetical protein